MGTFLNFVLSLFQGMDICIFSRIVNELQIVVANRILLLLLLLSLEKFELYTFRMRIVDEINGIFKITEIAETSSRFKISLPEECET